MSRFRKLADSAFAENETTTNAAWLLLDGAPIYLAMCRVHGHFITPPPESDGAGYCFVGGWMQVGGCEIGKMDWPYGEDPSTIEGAT